MQLLLDESEEFGITKGLGLIPGRVIPIPNLTQLGEMQKIPHIGWNALHPGNKTSWDKDGDCEPDCSVTSCGANAFCDDASGIASY